MPTKGGYIWEVGAPAPDIEPHSMAKHEVLDGYLRQYVRVVTANRRMETLNLTLVDGFAGGGRYRSAIDGSIVPGSPSLMLRAMADAAGELTAQDRRAFFLDVRYIFVEADARVGAHLRGVLEEEGFGPRLGHDISLLAGAFEEKIEGIISNIRERGPSGRSIFVLDQYGYSDVLLATIRRIFTKLKRSEVILTLATDSMIDFLADSPAHEKALAPLEIDPKALLAAKTDGPDWRRAVQYLLHEHIVRECGAAYFTPFFIVSPDAHRSYWLLHMSGHPRARDEMARLHWNTHNHFAHYGGSGLKMLGYSPALDPRITGQLAFSFDQAAREATLTALVTELPTRLWPYIDGVPFDRLFASIANETPAHSGLVKEAVLRLADDGTLELRGGGGGKLRRLDRLDGSALIVPRRQGRLFVSPPRKPTGDGHG